MPDDDRRNIFIAIRYLAREANKEKMKDVALILRRALRLDRGATEETPPEKSPQKDDPDSS
ncbi:hypothetical protein SAMN06273572_1073 [Monaibacterium marinum]|uniref:Uncharacterized protein n=1 Tax=Pontivivens marinum TaxID=1690039 RepID=A0A2C9CUN7_9RHOB|nr:hypothetical protein [Monaibacterium marinum]SOH94982.1 hypothetical protein SAMN06273572_1073 [Monaibacterium marinum]